MRKILIIGAGPAGIFTALELIKKGSKDEITIIEQGHLIEKRSRISGNQTPHVSDRRMSHGREKET